MFLHTPVPSPSGARRITPAMLAARDRADAFKGVSKGNAKPLRYLAAFQEAEPYLGLPPQAFKLVAWLLKMTQPCDWEEGSRPISWPSAEVQAEFLGLSAARVKVLNRALFEAGILILRDSPTGKRYGRRAPDGHIIEAYGFDLSPLALRYEEFIRLAAAARADRERLAGLRRRVTITRRSIRQVGEALSSLGSLPPEWGKLANDAAELVVSMRAVRDTDKLARLLLKLEARKIEAEEYLKACAKPVEISPVGLENEPHNRNSTNESFNPEDTVASFEEGSRGGQTVPSLPDNTDDEESPTFKPFERVERIQPSELVQLAPRLAAHIWHDCPDWADVVDAAGDGLSRELGVSQPLWGDACRVLGRPLAAIALAVVSTKPKGHFVRGAGGYFAAMVKRAKTGELHLDRSLWKLRREKWGV